MPGYTVQAHRARLDAAFARARGVEDLQLQADLAKYLCVLVAGYLEQSTSHILVEFAAAKSHPAVSRYVEARLDRFTNANAKKLCDLVGSFDNQIRRSFETFLTGERKDSIDSVVANRHRIAHGEDVGLTLFRIENYSKNVDDAIDFLTIEFS